MILDQDRPSPAQKESQMKNHRITRPARAVATLALAVLAFGTPALADGLGLAVMMERMQTYTHKLQLSIEARNARLADFYLHELEEAGEYVAEHIPHYGDYPVGQLTSEMLLPAIEQLEDSVEAGDWAASDADFRKLLEACNACHLVTGKGYIRIVPARVNPFAQDFSVVED
jgi:hypothetical protein